MRSIAGVRNLTPDQVKEGYREAYEALGFYFLASQSSYPAGCQQIHCLAPDLKFTILREATQEEIDAFFQFVDMSPDPAFPHHYIIMFD